MVIRKVNVTAASEEEYAMRVGELQKRGYEIVKELPVERPEDREISYDSTKRGQRKPRVSYVGFARHRAVMQKEFAEVEA
jgi:hypothetical protein